MQLTNALTAGISDKPPRKKHVDSLIDESNIDGPTLPKILPMCSAFVSFGRFRSR